jgi:DNA processing protein
MNTQEGRAWRALAAVKGLGPRALWRIAAYLSRKGKAASWILENPEKLGEALGMSRAGFAVPGLTLREPGGIERFPEREVTLLHPLHPDFPRRLQGLEEKLPLPALLYVRGNIALLERTGAAIVGQRRAGEEALAAAASLAAGLAARGINVVSGYAAGIDCAAHAAALRAGGTTTLVLAEGLHHFQTRPELQDHLTVDNVLVVSQFAPDARWAAFQAMARNQLVAALSAALVVVISGPERDADQRMSGSFNAALSAIRLGIPVFAAAPASFSPPPVGNRDLIRKGAIGWDTAAGAEPIVAAIRAAAARKAPEQGRLF